MEKDWCIENLRSLRNDSKRIVALNEIRLRLNQSSNLETIVTYKLLRAPEIYECLEDDTTSGRTSEQTDLASDILAICMSNLSLSQSEMPDLLDPALGHSCSRIRALALNTILKELQSVDNIKESSAAISDKMLHHIFNALTSPDTEVGVPAIRILSIILQDRLNQETVKATLLRLLESGEIIKCRVFEVAVNLAKISPLFLDNVKPILDRAVSELNSTDVLFQVNVLEILATLSEQNHGLLYMEQKHVFDVVSNRIECLEQNPLDRLLIPGIIKFFGKIAIMQPQKIIIGYPDMILMLFESIEGEDLTILPSSFDTLANLTKTKQGKLLMDAHYGTHLEKVFNAFSQHLRNLPTELKNRAFDTLEVIFTAQPNVMPEISEIIYKWYVYLADGSDMTFLMDFCRNPFPDIKVACLKFISAVCSYSWGITALRNTGGFVEYLLDRKIEFDKDAKYAKYDLICLLADSTDFDVQTHLQLRTYVNVGPFFVESSVNIATEND